MNRARNDQFFSNLKKFVNKVYPNQSQRQPYLNLKSWPSPRDEAWKFSRLGKLARKNILPLNLENQQDFNINKLIKDSISLVFVNGKFAGKAGKGKSFCACALKDRPSANSPAVKKVPTDFAAFMNSLRIVYSPNLHFSMPYPIAKFIKNQGLFLWKTLNRQSLSWEKHNLVSLAYFFSFIL